MGPSAAPDGAGSRSVSLVIREAATATVVWRGTAWERGGQASRNPGAKLALTPGDYTIEATCNELRATGSLTVAAPGPAKATLTLQKP